jgi:alpha-glucosidase (family GH31 glycosyl hydrolase)
VSAFVDELHSNGQKFVPIVDPGILAVDSSWDWAQGYDAYDKGMEMDVFVKDLNGEKPYMGQVWPGPVHFPDWFHPNATDYWTEQLKNWHDIAAFDGVWVDMNEVRYLWRDITSYAPHLTNQPPALAPRFPTFAPARSAKMTLLILALRTRLTLRPSAA